MNRILQPALAAMLAMVAGSATAGSYSSDATDICSAPNCRAVLIAGEAQRNEPWVWQVNTTAGECLRLHITSSSTDLEMALVSSDPAKTAGGVNFVWANDNNGADTRTAHQGRSGPASRALCGRRYG